ncbi:MAG: SDR family NAD(P)-dependent oxidoreductase [Candidatus Thermoplasmatota archaeon]
MDSLEKFYENKIILVTGGCGSIGSEIVKKLLKFNVKTIRIFDNNESKLFDMEQELKTNKIRPFIGDVRDKNRLLRSVENVDFIFHAAALKHVPLCEYNPFEAVKTNILGTENVINAALKEEIEKLVFISTDKAVNPTNVMGASKLLAEKITTSANNFKGLKKTTFCSVRFGNVLNSNGSVIPLFKKQIKNGGPVTVTDPNMTRFFMKIPQAVELVLKAGFISTGGETFIFKMPTVCIGDLVEATIDYFASKYDYKPEDIEVKIIGKRPGEKKHEDLMNDTDTKNAYENKEMFITMPTKSQIEKWNLEKTKRKKYSSKDKKPLTKKQIIHLLE